MTHNQYEINIINSRNILLLRYCIATIHKKELERHQKFPFTKKKKNSKRYLKFLLTLESNMIHNLNTISSLGNATNLF